jgi:nitrate/nitrite transporter NarK
MVKNSHLMNQQKASWYYLLLLIISGESVFILPFVLARVFRPTVLEAFGLDNVQLGFCFSIYGVVALFSYLLGGPLADKYPPRKLIATSLWLTAAGGFVYATFPDFIVLRCLYGYWGFTTIFLFWPSLIKATRVWGGTNSQGKAFGFLDGGRGLIGASFGALGVLIFSLFISSEISTSTIAENRAAFRYVILVCIGIIFFVGLLVWFFMKLDDQMEVEITLDRIDFSKVRQVIGLPSVWLLMIIICCAYVGYKITDVFSLYAQEVMGYDKVHSAQVGTFLLFIRPVVGIGIGLLADRSQTTFWLLIGFIFSFIGALLFATGWLSSSSTVLFYFSTLVVATGVYSVRCLYFAVMESGQIPILLTGTAVGLISIVGFTPDIFAGPAMGYLLDSAPGVQGHRHVFWMLAMFSFIGGLAAWFYYRLYNRNSLN